MLHTRARFPNLRLDADFVNAVEPGFRFFRKCDSSAAGGVMVVNEVAFSKCARVSRVISGLDPQRYCLARW